MIMHIEQFDYIGFDRHMPLRYIYTIQVKITVQNKLMLLYTTST